MKQKIIAFVVSLVMIVSIFPGMTAVAEVGFVDTLEEVLGVDMLASSNDWNFARSTMTAYTRGGYQSIETPRGATFTESGLDLSGTNGSESWKFSAFRGWSPLKIGGNDSYRAVTFKVKGSVSTVVKTPDNYSFVALNSEPDTPLSSSKTTGGESAVRDVTYDITPDENWIEYLMVPRNNNAVYLWAKSVSLTNGKWVKVMGLDRYDYAESNSDPDYNWFRDQGINFSGSGVVAGFKTLDYNTDTRTVVVSDETAKADGANYLLLEEEFDQAADGGSTFTAGTGVEVTGNGVAYFRTRYANAEAGITATGGAITFLQTEIPMNGYAEFRIKSNGLKKFLVDDGTSNWNVTLNCDYSAFPGTAAEGGGYLSDSDMSWRTWRLVRKEDGYSIYSITDGDSGWRLHTTQINSGTTEGNGAKVSITLYGNCDEVNDGNGEMDYLRIYGSVPKTTMKLLNADGTVVTDYSNIKDPSNVKILVDGVCEKDRTLLVAHYNANDILVDADVFSVPKGTKDMTIPYDFSDDDRKIQYYKVLLWDEFSKIDPQSGVLVVDGNITRWQQEWNFGGNTKVENQIIFLESESGVSSFAEWNTEVPDAFDISWDMEIAGFGEEETVIIHTGSRSVSLTFSADEISYLTKDGVKTSPWAIGTQKHNYRLLHKDGVCHLLVDGYYVDVLKDMQTSTASDAIRFENKGGANQSSVLKIEPIIIANYSAGNVPSSQGFFHNFDSAEESSGWNFTPKDDGSGNETSSWEIKDGNLQCVDYRTSQTTSVAQRYFNEVKGDDFVFLARMQIPSFGTLGQFNIYFPNRTLVLNLKQKFFGMRTPDALLAASNNTPENIYSDPIMIDPTKWYNLRIETYDYCTKVRVYLDDEKIMDGEMSEGGVGSGKKVFDLRSNADRTQPFAIKYDWLKCAPITYGITVSGITDGAVIAEGAAISLTSSVAGGASSSVQYCLSGNVVATGSGYRNSATLSNLPAGTHILTAVCENKFSAPICFTVKGASKIEGDAHIVAGSNYANEVIYEATGDGDVTFGNGVHLLKLTHKNGILSYLTDTGAEEYLYGTGKFHIITEGPVADVYRNGQFVFSFYMPLQSEKTESFTGNVTGTVVTTIERKTYFSANNFTETEGVYQLPELPYHHVVDFVAERDDEFHIALNDGYYRTNLSFEDGEIYVWNGQRNNSLAEKISIASADKAEAYYRIETSVGMSRLYKNGRWIGTFRGVPTVGENTLAVNVTSGALKYIAVCDNTDVYLHQDDFDGDREFESDGYWMTYGAMQVSVDKEKKTMSLKANGAKGIAQLSASCGDASLSADVSVTSGNGFWFIANRATRESYTKIGYSFAKQRYEIVDYITSVAKDSNGDYQETVTETLVKSKKGNLSLNQVKSMEAQVQETTEGKKVTLLVDGIEVLSAISEFDCRGTVGFLVENGSASLSDVAFRGDAKPMIGVTDFMYDGSKMMDMIENFDTGEVYLLNSAGQGYATADGGKTWGDKKVAYPGSNHLYQFYQDTELSNGTVFKKGDILSVSKNGNGTINGVSMIDEYGQALYANFMNKSSDYGESWSLYSAKNYYFPKLDEVKANKDSNGATVNAFKRGYSGRFYYVANTGGNEDYGGANVWYSDNGKAWTRSQTTILSKELGFVIAEAQVLETRNFTRLYFRTDMGSIGYFESSDRGRTWNLTPRTTPFISIASCFNVEVDPLEPDTVYIAWVYDNTNLFSRHQFPRMRWAVAKSVDGGETWEMVGTVHENTSAFLENSNMTMNVSSDYIFVSAQSSEYYRAVSPVNSRIVAFPKESQRTSKRYERLHLQYPEQVNNTKVMPDEQAVDTLVIHQESGAVWFDGIRYKNAFVDNCISLECAAKLVGANVEVNVNGTVTLRIQDAKKTFTQKDLISREEEIYISVPALVERFGLLMVEEEGIVLIGENQDWSQRQKNAFKYAVDLFSNQP